MNDEETEHAMDIVWAIASADHLLVALGYPVADIVEEDNDE